MPTPQHMFQLRRHWKTRQQNPQNQQASMLIKILPSSNQQNSNHHQSSNQWNSNQQNSNQQRPPSILRSVAISTHMMARVAWRGVHGLWHEESLWPENQKRCSSHTTNANDMLCKTCVLHPLCTRNQMDGGDGWMLWFPNQMITNERASESKHTLTPQSFFNHLGLLKGWCYKPSTTMPRQWTLPAWQLTCQLTLLWTLRMVSPYH